VIREWLIGRGLFDNVSKVPVDYRHRRGLHDGYVFDGTVAKERGGYGYRYVTIGMYVPVKSRDVKPVQVRESADVSRKLLLVCKRIGICRPRQKQER